MRVFAVMLAPMRAPKLWNPMPHSTMPSPWDLWRANWTNAARLGETMLAANVVVASRMATIAAAVHDPLAADGAELSRMVTEKLDAFGQAGASLARDAGAMGADMVSAAYVLGALSTGGFGAVEHGRRWSSSIARATHRAMGAPGRALAPVHARATDNAERLRGDARRKRPRPLPIASAKVRKRP